MTAKFPEPVSPRDGRVDERKLPTYVLITPARNEEEFIEDTIRSVVAQTVRPLRWVIVSDGSTDGTDAIVARYCAEHSWMELQRTPLRKERNFAGKVNAFNTGYASLRGMEYQCVCSLDADLTFDKDHFAYLLERMAENPRLGLTGTAFTDGNTRYDYRYVSVEHVSGACQLFRRECFESIGGYVPLKSGGVDHVAVLTARLKGWETRTFTDRVAVHHRKMGRAQYGTVRAKFEVGKLDYALGGHPLWELFRSAYQMSKPPFILGGLMILLGYYSSMLRGVPQSVTPELMQFRHREQIARLRRFLLRKS